MLLTFRVGEDVPAPADMCLVGGANATLDTIERMAALHRAGEPRDSSLRITRLYVLWLLRRPSSQLWSERFASLDSSRSRIMLDREH